MGTFIIWFFGAGFAAALLMVMVMIHQYVLAVNMLNAYLLRSYHDAPAAGYPIARHRFDRIVLGFGFPDIPDREFQTQLRAARVAIGRCAMAFVVAMMALELLLR